MVAGEASPDLVDALLALSPDEFKDYTVLDVRGLLQRLEVSGFGLPE